MNPTTKRRKGFKKNTYTRKQKERIVDQINDISDKESTNLARSRNMSVISQSKTIGFE